MTASSCRIEKLQALRVRDLDRAARAAAEAVAAAERASAARAKAECARVEARSALDGAIEDRARRPADELVRMFVTTCEQRLGDTQRLLATANQALGEALERVAATRRLWMRAQARLDALDTLVRKIRSGERRARDRRASDEANERRASAGGLAWA
ncbi:hypothetical protein [Sphingomonas sanxanigenens]|uniref:Flagellar FliJ protein n=1 Tax=Sphingomonas sanxanigenens DSM 19645 = NX02 TaxID=1123269 RepID=W0ACP1_9SPHN|nr:hypothetical protein [Sphingomonas sanxanigenens]AHE54856.1 hypothetical protein NX02_15880 [Sphingomonas sanxanigenens DSM 19645 = NX02]